MSEHDTEAERLQDEIEETREQLGETVEQLAAKADVKARAHQAVEERKEAVRETVDTGVQQAKRKPYVPAAAGVAILALAFLIVRRRRS
jgi:MYXO-CTERM domain-containing protein